LLFLAVFGKIEVMFRTPIIVLLLCSTLLSSVKAHAAPPPAAFDVNRILQAIQQVETGGCKDPSNAVGDGGKAIGAFQIHRAYWQDAVEFDKSIGGVYADCKRVEYAQKIVRAYLTRYCKVWTDETVARIHNGGGSILKRQGTKAWAATTVYWNKVQRQLASL